MDSTAQTTWTPELQRWLDRAAHETGFAAAGIAAVRNSAQDSARFTAWIDSGRAGEMDYLKRRDQSGALLRSSPTIPMPWARSVVVCAFNYNGDAPLSIDPAPPGAGWIARYAWSGQTGQTGQTGRAVRADPAQDGGSSTVPTDYHDQLLRRLRTIEAGLLAQASCTTRCYVDTGPILERSFAAQAGVGWIGKNTCVIHQRLGSWLLLGVIVTSLPLTGEPAPQTSASPAALLAPDRCGTCTRCIDACPTGALLGSRDPAAPREMDASRCIAYLTIEKKGSIDPALREPMGRHVFGCDICQDVCPWNSAHHRTSNRAPTAVNHEGMQARPELINPALDWLASMDAQQFNQYFKGSPLHHTGRKRLLRNVAIAMGNSRQPRFLPKLDQWAQESSDTNDAPLREAAHWARERILSRSDPTP